MRGRHILRTGMECVTAPRMLASDPLPTVAIIISSRNEPFHVARMTFDSALNQYYPGDRLTVIVADNSDPAHPDYAPWRDYVLSCCGAGGDVQTRFIHRDGTGGFKAGNMDLGLQATTSEFVLFLDVDSTLPPDCLAQTVPEFGMDPALAFVQFHLVGTNGATSPLATAGVWALGAARYWEGMRGACAGWALFAGHNALWRNEVLQELGTCVDQYKGKDIVAEDASLTIRASLHGYYGRILWHTTGEWVPGSLQDLEAMWARWTYGTCQAVLKYWRFRLDTAGDDLTLSERLDILHRGCSYPLIGLLPLWIVLPFVSRGVAGLVGLCMSLLVMAPLLGHCLRYLTNHRFRGQFNRPVRHRDFLLGMLVVEPFVTWAKLKAVWRFVLRRPQGWKPTGKSGTPAGGWLRVCWRWKDLLIFGSSILVWFVADAWGGLDLRALSLRIPALLSSAGLLLSVALYGKSQIAHPDDLEASTSINAILSRDLPYERPMRDCRKAG